MKMPKLIPLRLKDGDSLRRWELLEDWEYQLDTIHIFIPKGFITDFASIPWGFRNLYDPTGYLLLSGLIHDFLYQHGGYHEIFAPEISRYFIPVDRRRADLMFRRVANIEHPSRRNETIMAYRALRVGGGQAWDNHRNALYNAIESISKPPSGQNPK